MSWQCEGVPPCLGCSDCAPAPPRELAPGPRPNESANESANDTTDKPVPSLARRRMQELIGTVLNHNPSRGDIADRLELAIAALGQPDTEAQRDSERWRQLVGLLADRDVEVHEPEDVAEVLQDLTRCVGAYARKGVPS